MMKVQRECKGHRGAVNCVRFTFDGNYVMSGSDDREIILWNPHKDDPSSTNQSLKVKSYSGVHGNPVLDIAIAPTNDRFISCGGDKTCFLWDVSTGVVVRRFQGHTQRINTVDINRDGTVFMSGSYDKTLCIWDLRSNNKDPIQTLTDFKDSVTCITHTKLVQGSIIAGSTDGCIRMYDLRTGLLHTDNISDCITSVCLSYDERFTLSSSVNGPLRLLDISSGKVINEYSGHIHTAYKTEAVISNNDLSVLCGSEDGKIYKWDLKSTKVTNVTDSNSSHSRGVSSIVYHKDLPVCVTASYDGSIKVWSDLNKM